jgi:hypothetical protein
VILASAACWVAALLIVARGVSATAGAFAVAGVLLVPSAFRAGITALLALGCWLLAAGTGHALVGRLIAVADVDRARPHAPTGFADIPYCVSGTEVMDTAVN